MIAWLIYSALVSLLVAAAAIAVDWAARLARRATRWVWLGAMIAAVALVSFAPLRWAEMPASPLVIRTVGAPAAVLAPPTALQEITTALVAVQRLFDAPLVAGIAWIQHRVPASAPAFALGAWLVASVLLALVFGIVHLRFGQARRRWPLTDLHGSQVRVSPNAGPVVIGLTRPEIVVPRWMLEHTSAAQRVVIAHEAEHVRARDPMLLAAGWSALILMPWNPALWFMLSRLRLAVELDCDARVLRAGVAPKTYGDLLIDLAERAAPLRLATTALADDSSHLAQRILAMKPEIPRFAFVRAAAVGAVGIASLIAACSTALPTDADINKMDATSAEGAARKLSLVTKDSVVYTVDGVAASAAAAKALPADRIASVHVDKVIEGASIIAIVTKEPDGQASRVAIANPGLLLRKRTGDSMVVNGKSLLAKEGSSSPILIVDGVRVDQAKFATLDKSVIESVEIVKGKAAAELYGADAEHGVITVTTKGHPAKKG